MDQRCPVSEPMSRSTGDDIDFRNRLITVQAARANDGEVRGGPMNEVLTQALRTTKINELIGPVLETGWAIVQGSGQRLCNGDAPSGDDRFHRL
jgi:hypothetical protein